jgi:1-acyl-sn-glycerol-3-phosphate acyltransferase
MTSRRGRWSRTIQVDHPGRFSPRAIHVVRRYLAPLVKVLHRPRLEGTEHLPSGPFLLVANHSAGIALAEILSFAVTYLEEVGEDRPLAAYVLPADFHVWPVSALVRESGAIPATYDAAERGLADGVPILMFPGGDFESLRPVWQANRVDFGGRVGFLRIARASGLPIVPMGIRGSHFTAPILLRSRLLANALVLPRLVGVKRWGLSVLGLFGAAAIASLTPLPWPAKIVLIWLWLGTPLVFLPWIPWTIRMRIGAPLEASSLSGPGDTTPSEDGLRAALHRVERAVQTLVDA